MSDMIFPGEFSGITHAITLNEYDFNLTVGYLLGGCQMDHAHNYAVAVDGRHIYTTKLGIDCIYRLLNEVYEETDESFYGPAFRVRPE